MSPELPRNLARRELKDKGMGGRAMPEALAEKLDSLKNEIEDLRRLLYFRIEEARGALNNASTYEISSKLDKLIAQFLRIKERLSDGDEE